MELVAEVLGSDAVIHEDLYDWLRGEPELVSAVRLRRNPPERGELGALADAVVVAVGAGGALSVLASALVAWVQQPKNRELRIEVRLTSRDGHTVVIKTQGVDAAQAEQMLKAVLSETRQEGPEAPGEMPS